MLMFPHLNLESFFVLFHILYVLVINEGNLLHTWRIIIFHHYLFIHGFLILLSFLNPKLKNYLPISSSWLYIFYHEFTSCIRKTLARSTLYKGSFLRKPKHFFLSWEIFQYLIHMALISFLRERNVYFIATT